MLTYRAPFLGATRMDTMVAILERDHAPLFQPKHNSLPAMQRLQNLVDKILHKDSAKRYQTAVELLTELGAVGQQLDVADESIEELALS